jgi:hypothetical protein
MNARRILSTSAVATVAVLLSIGVQTLAYTAPTAAPTGNDAEAPLNVGSASQSKAGTLYVNSSGAAGSLGLRAGGDIRTLNGNLKVLDPTGIGYAVISQKYCFGTYSNQDITPTDCIYSWPNTTGFISTDATAQTKTGVLKLGVAPGTAASDISLVLDGRIRIEGGTADVASAGQVLAADGSGGDASWKSPTTELGLQKAVSGTSPQCTVGSSITGINPTTGAITCGKAMKAGAVTVGSSPAGNVAIAVTGLGFPDATYAVTVTSDGSYVDCRTPFVTSKTSSGFTVSAVDRCADVTYYWMALDY